MGRINLGATEYMKPEISDPTTYYFADGTRSLLLDATMQKLIRTLEIKTPNLGQNQKDNIVYLVERYRKTEHLRDLRIISAACEVITCRQFNIQIMIASIAKKWGVKTSTLMKYMYSIIEKLHLEVPEPGYLRFISKVCDKLGIQHLTRQVVERYNEFQKMEYETFSARHPKTVISAALWTINIEYNCHISQKDFLIAMGQTKSMIFYAVNMYAKWKFNIPETI